MSMRPKSRTLPKGEDNALDKSPGGHSGARDFRLFGDGRADSQPDRVGSGPFSHATHDGAGLKP